MNELALFAGAGGGILGGKLIGWRTVCAVEWQPYAIGVLCQRQNDGILQPFPIWDDVRTFDGRPWRGIVDVVSGGFPCQDISIAGKGAGLDGVAERDGAGLVEEQRAAVARGLDGPARHREDVVLENTVHARDADRREDEGRVDDRLPQELVAAVGFVDRRARFDERLEQVDRTDSDDGRRQLDLQHRGVDMAEPLGLVGKF